MQRIIIGVLITFVLFSAGCKKEIPETGPDTVCSTDADCWCRTFTGAGFVEGKGSKSPSRCCTPEFAEQNVGMCPELNRCIRCLYE